MLELGREPCGGDGVPDVIGIEERDQNIDVEQGAHSVGVLFTQPIYLFVGHQSTATLKWHEATHASARRLCWDMVSARRANSDSTAPAVRAD